MTNNIMIQFGSHVKLFLPFYKFDESEDFELDDVYVTLGDDPISSSGDEFDE